MLKTPNPVDVHVGSRVRLRRMTLGMSQERLGRLLGLTFQQIQKYEKGANRIGASRLFAISRVLDAPIQFFFDELPDEAAAGLAKDAPKRKAEQPGDIRVADYVATAEGLELNRSFHRITDQATRRHLAELVRSVAGES
ncbi:helix-turn-helix transcriptional regulator [Pikeienuella piscinae]|uniref:Helix-turn-helix transcriptional regulator n=1 Tax=Pikeienuella piscinae TaxID=2748098 RepID=A0A7M3T5G1_9RHOB|nr:helix-turn-helix transcriptional regulator [Pikeienuella piscinae]QIE57242.1 helix-turn-helix transcriptional regulator [Pikeienuella piscinae]